MSREAAKRLGKSKAVVDYKEYAGRPHFTAGAPGWEAVADYALDWANRHVGAPGRDGGAGEGLTPQPPRPRGRSARASARVASSRQGAAAAMPSRKQSPACARRSTAPRRPASTAPTPLQDSTATRKGWMITPTTSTDPLVEALATRLRLIDLIGWQRIAT